MLVTWPLLVWAAFGDGRGARPDGGTVRRTRTRDGGGRTRPPGGDHHTRPSDGAVRRTRLVGAAGAATLLLAVTVAWLTHSAVVGRYTAVVVPLALLLLGVGAARLPRPATAVVVTGLTLAWLAVDAVLVARPRTDAASVAAVLDRQLTDADTVIFCPDQLAPDVVRLLDHRPRLLSLPHQDWPGRLDWTDYRRRIETEDPARLARQVADGRGDGAVWLVPRYGYRPFGTRCQQLGAALLDLLGPADQYPVPDRRGAETVWRWAPP